MPSELKKTFPKTINILAILIIDKYKTIFTHHTPVVCHRLFRKVPSRLYNFRP